VKLEGEVERLNEIHKGTVRMYNTVYTALTEIIEKVKEKEFKDEELVDLGYLCREISKVCDDLRKEANAKMDLISKTLVYKYADNIVNDPASEDTIRGKLATASPDVKNEPRIPKKGTPEFAELCRFFGISDEAISSGAVTFHWKHLSNYITDCQKAGKNPPEALDFKTVFIANYRKKRNAG